MRIMIGAGLIKIRGDQCWRDLTCMNYFYQTQPNPNPISYYIHFAPESWHMFETFGNHMVELVFPFFTLVPLRIFGMINGFFQILFQFILISTGNLSFLNWLTILPSIWFFDDQSLAFLFKDQSRIERNESSKQSKDHSNYFYTKLRLVINLTIGALLAYLSYPIVLNLMSSSQIMNTSFEPFRLVNTYGAFGSVTKKRTEVVFEGTYSQDPKDPNAIWLEYDFKCKPGNLTQTPCLISPFHYRLDWLMWFAAFQNYQSNPWLVHLAGKMLDNDPIVDSLILNNPFKGQPKPEFVRARHYEYTFTKIGSKDYQKGKWWKRKLIGDYLPAVNRRMLQVAYDQFGWRN